MQPMLFSCCCTAMRRCCSGNSLNRTGTQGQSGNTLETLRVPPVSTQTLGRSKDSTPRSEDDVGKLEISNRTVSPCFAGAFNIYVRISSRQLPPQQEASPHFSQQCARSTYARNSRNRDPNGPRRGPKTIRSMNSMGTYVPHVLLFGYLALVGYESYYLWSHRVRPGRRPSGLIPEQRLRIAVQQQMKRMGCIHSTF